MKFKCWNITYVMNRINEFIYQKSHPQYPWLTKSANSILQSLLKSTDVGLEFGSGRSTVWFAKRLSLLTSVENDELWYNKVNNLLQNNNLANVKYILCPEDSEQKGQDSNYHKIADDFPDKSLDFVLVDGIYRDLCAYAVLDKVRAGGILVIDNANWYLPSESISPDSRTTDEGPASQTWAEFLRRVENWRCIWTSSGVTDTAIYFKPCNE
jgi:predicted O-methyltransferase YrrM